MATGTATKERTTKATPPAGTDQQAVGRFSMGFEYGFPGRTRRIDWGQVFELQNTPGDEKLFRLGYIEPMPARASTIACRECGAEFIGTQQRDRHIQRRHPDREMDAEAIDEVLAADEQFAMTATPLYLENTKATLDSTGS